MTDTAKDMPELEKCREAFETWWTGGYKDLSVALIREGEGYKFNPTHRAWETWQVAWNTRADLSRPQAPAEGEVAEAVRQLQNEIDKHPSQTHVEIYARDAETLIQASTRSSAHQAPSEGEIVWRCAMSEPPETPASTWSEQVLVRFEDGSFDVSSYYNAQTLDGMWLQDAKPKQWCYIQAATRSNQTGAEGLVKALENSRSVMASTCGHIMFAQHQKQGYVGKIEDNIERLIAENLEAAITTVEQALAAHRKQTEANNEKREG